MERCITRDNVAEDAIMNGVLENINGDEIIVGCNYHTTWQSKKGMRFVLSEIKGERARLTTRNSNKNFWVNINDLIMINSIHNQKKGQNLLMYGQTKNKTR